MGRDEHSSGIHNNRCKHVLMVLKQTLHPADKDYGHMKIDEPKTPYSYQSGSGDEGEASGTEGNPTPIEHMLDTDNLLKKIASRSERRLSIEDGLSGGDDEEVDDESLTEEERQKKREFEVKRKSHYNEFQVVFLTRFSKSNISFLWATCLNGS